MRMAMLPSWLVRGNSWERPIVEWPALVPTCHRTKSSKPSASAENWFASLEPLDFIAKLAALVPRPRVNLTRNNGVPH